MDSAISDCTRQFSNQVCRGDWSGGQLRNDPKTAPSHATAAADDDDNDFAKEAKIYVRNAIRQNIIDINENTS